MPSKYVIRLFEENGYYHVYNRGVEKRVIFIDDQDHHIFLYYLFVYSAPLERVLLKYPNLPIRLYNKNLSNKIDILAYCLMPNHFHLLIKQHQIDGVTHLLKQVTNAYTKYFNFKYKRVGPLFQGRFKAVNIITNDQLIHVMRYIHLNPLVSQQVTDLKTYHWSSFQNYINDQSDFVNKNEILSFFKDVEGLKNFILDQADYAKELEHIKHLAIDEE